MFFHVFCARRVSAPWSTYLPLRRALRCAWDGVQKYSAQCSSHICEATPNPLCRQGKEAKLTPKPADPQATLIYTHIRRTYGDQQCWKFMVKARRSHHAQTHRKSRHACRHHNQHVAVGRAVMVNLSGCIACGHFRQPPRASLAPYTQHVHHAVHASPTWLRMHKPLSRRVAALDNTL